MNGSPVVAEEFGSGPKQVTRLLTVNGMTGLSCVSSIDHLEGEPDLRSLQYIWDKTSLKVPVTYSSTHGTVTTIKIADLFCGAGGLSSGVREAIRACGFRYKSVLAVDIDPIALDVYRRNFDPAQTSNGDAWISVTKNYSTRIDKAHFTATPQVLNENLRGPIGSVDILIGGPPCEGHSNSNNHTRRTDQRNSYYVVMPAMAVVLGARAVIVENVPGVQHDHREVLKVARELFETSGYYVDAAVVDATALGLPQTRKRHVLIASKERQPKLEMIINALRRPQRDLSWAIDDLRCIGSTDPFDSVPTLSEVNQRRIKYLFDNNEYDLPNHQRPASHRNGHTYPSIYGRLRWDQPSGTITTGFNTPGRGRYIHPDIQRTITAHEAARIQGFPDVFEFKLVNGTTPTRAALAKMIGDAVPPPMGYVAGLAALAAMDLSHEQLTRR